jgi:general stress protein YciG
MALQKEQTTGGHKMTAAEAGRRGGEATREKHRGSSFYAEIGRRGGEVVSRNRKHMSEIGKRGGRAKSRDRGQA